MSDIQNPTAAPEESAAIFRRALTDALSASGLSPYLNDRTIELSTALYLRMVEENRRYNLTAVTDPERAALFHFADSIAAAPLFPEGAQVLDIGAGGGFPTLPLAIVRPDLSVTALDATAKKTAYIAESARLLGLLNVTTLTGRAEELAHDARYRERFDAVTARAVAALPVLSELSLPFLRVGGRFYALKGAAAPEEHAASLRAAPLLGGAFLELRPLFVGGNSETLTRFADVIEKRRPTPKDYPRPYARILKKPL